MEIRKKVDDLESKKYKIRNSDAILVMVEPKPKELTAIRKACTYKKRGARGLAPEFNESKFNKDCMNKFIVGWENITLDGKPVECNLEHKILCDDNWTEFNDCWNDVVMGAEEADEIESAEELKNS